MQTNLDIFSIGDILYPQKFLRDDEFDIERRIGGNAVNDVFVCRNRMNEKNLVLKVFPSELEAKSEILAMSVASPLAANMGIVVPKPTFLLVRGNQVLGYFSKYLGATTPIDEAWAGIERRRRGEIKMAIRGIVPVLTAAGVKIDGFDTGICRNTSILHGKRQEVMMYDLTFAGEGACQANQPILETLDFWLPD